MKEQITQDIAIAAGKIVPTAGIVVGTYNPGYTLSDVAVVCTIVFTVLQTFTLVVKNWGDWSSWWAARRAQLRRLINWIRGRG